MPQLRRGRSSSANVAAAEDLECPLCMELPDAEVHQCVNNHFFCGDCLSTHQRSGHAASNKCPTCRVALGDEPVRNRGVEARIGLLPGQCDCGKGMLRKDLKVHMATCEEVVIECPFPGCSMRMPRRDLAAHMNATVDEHVRLAQAHFKELQTARAALASMTCNIELTLHQLNRDGSLEQLDLDYGIDLDLELNLMEPIAGQSEWLEFFSEHTIDLSGCKLSVDITKTPYELDMGNPHVEIPMVRVEIPRELIPAHIIESMAARVARLAEREAEHERWMQVEAMQEEARALMGGLNLKVVTEDGNEIFFKLRETTPMHKLMAACCNRLGVGMHSVRFLFDGQRIDPNQTPQELEMEDGDVIDVVCERT